MGFIKNLTAGEIVDQFLQLQQHSSKPITNVVFMGMGEPFLNYNAVINASKLLNEKVEISMEIYKLKEELNKLRGTNAT